MNRKRRASGSESQASEEEGRDTHRPEDQEIQQRVLEAERAALFRLTLAAVAMAVFPGAFNEVEIERRVADHPKIDLMV